MLCQGPKNWFKYKHVSISMVHKICSSKLCFFSFSLSQELKLPVKFVLYKWRHNYEFNSASSSKDYLFICCTHVKQNPYPKAPDDDLDPGTAAKIVWEIHKKRN